MRKELQATTEQVCAHIDMLMKEIDSIIAHGHRQGIASAMDEIAACNRLLARTCVAGVTDECRVVVGGWQARHDALQVIAAA